MAKVRHIALHTPDLEKTAEFFKRVLLRPCGGCSIVFAMVILRQ